MGATQAPVKLLPRLELQLPAAVDPANGQGRDHILLLIVRSPLELFLYASNISPITSIYHQTFCMVNRGFARSQRDI